MMAGIFFAGAVILMVGCLLYMQEKKDGFILQAHRGWSEQYPENTVAAFEAAGKCKEFDGIETDVQETSDLVLVLMHDRKLDRTTNATGKIRDYTFQEVREFQIDGGNHVEEYPNEKIPTLEEFLDICRKYGKMPYIEMKSMTKEGVQKLIETLEADGWNGKCVLTTFQYKNVKRVRKITSDYPVEYMVTGDFNMEEIIEQLQGYDNVVFRPSAYAITKEMVELCKDHGIGIECYGLKVGDKKRLKELKKLGVSGGTCNDWRGLE